MLKSIICLVAIFLMLVPLGLAFMVNHYLKMPGKSYSGGLPESSGAGRQLSHEMEGHVRKLSSDIGERNWQTPKSLDRAADYIEGQFKACGYKVKIQEYQYNEQSYRNIVAEEPGTTKSDEIIVLGAHYDSVLGCPGANDNGTGVASLLCLAKMIRGERFPRTVRFVAFPNEESPFFGTEGMGSYQYARNCCRANERILAMLSLETLGYYCDERNSQAYPSLLRWFYPDTGNFVAFVGNLSNRALVRTCVDSFREHAKFPCEGGSAPTFLPGIEWSDHYSFNAAGYSALMVTDTAPYRYPYYHTPQDTAEHIDFPRLALVTQGLFQVVRNLAGPERIEGALPTR